MIGGVPSPIMRAAYTLLIAFLALGAEKLLGRVMILYGRRSFAALILLSFLIVVPPPV